MRWPRLVSALLVGATAAWTACGPDSTDATPTSAAAPPPTTLARSAGSLSGNWTGTSPGDGMTLDLPGCGGCAGSSSLAALDVLLNISDTSHSLTGNATLTVRQAPAQCPAAAHCPLRAGDVIPASVTGSVGVGARVTMQWTAAIGGPAPTTLVLDLEGVVAANHMSGTVSSPGGASATGTWSISLRQEQMAKILNAVHPRPPHPIEPGL